MYGPKRPILAEIISPVSGCFPSSLGRTNSFKASSKVISSGLISSGILALFGLVFFFLLARAPLGALGSFSPN